MGIEKSGSAFILLLFLRKTSALTKLASDRLFSCRPIYYFLNRYLKRYETSYSADPSAPSAVRSSVLCMIELTWRLGKISALLIVILGALLLLYSLNLIVLPTEIFGEFLPTYFLNDSSGLCAPGPGDSFPRLTSNLFYLPKEEILAEILSFFDS